MSFYNNAADPERDSAAVQNFLSNMEAAFRAHSLWAGCSEEELDSAGEVSKVCPMLECLLLVESPFEEIIVVFQISCMVFVVDKN